MSSPLQTPPKMSKPRRKGAARIEDPKKRNMTFFKRCRGLIKKATELCQLTGAQVAVIVFSDKDKLDSFGKPSVEKTIQKYHRHKGVDVIPPTSHREWEDWAKKQYDSCATREDLASSIKKHEFVLDHLRKKLKDLQDNPSVEAGASDDSLKDCIRDANWDRFFILSVDSAASSGSSGVDSTPMYSDHEDCEIDPSSFIYVPSDGGYLIYPKDSAVGDGSA